MPVLMLLQVLLIRGFRWIGKRVGQNWTESRRVVALRISSTRSDGRDGPLLLTIDLGPQTLGRDWSYL